LTHIDKEGQNNRLVIKERTPGFFKILSLGFGKIYWKNYLGASLEKKKRQFASELPF
jgi:hypothetical protein